MDTILQNISLEVIIVLTVNLFFFIILLIMNLSTQSKLKKLKSKYAKFMNGLSDRNIEELLDSCIGGINHVEDKNKEIEKQINYIERNLVQCIQKVGVVRFNAFENVGSDLSFSIVMMDDNETGLVISGIYSRDSSATYAKPIINGKSKYVLSMEEIQAFDLAKNSHGERLYTNN